MEEMSRMLHVENAMSLAIALPALPVVMTIVVVIPFETEAGNHVAPKFKGRTSATRSACSVGVVRENYFRQRRWRVRAHADTDFLRHGAVSALLLKGK